MSPPEQQGKQETDPDNIKLVWATAAFTPV